MILAIFAIFAIVVFVGAVLWIWWDMEHNWYDHD